MRNDGLHGLYRGKMTYENAASTGFLNVDTGACSVGFCESCTQRPLQSRVDSLGEPRLSKSRGRTHSRPTEQPEAAGTTSRRSEGNISVLMNLKTTTGGATTTDSDLVRASRDGDQFHYHWAARHCLSLLPGVSDLVAISIEGASAAEGPGSANEGDELIDVGFYFGSETLKDARLVRYVQLKHSTKRVHEPWTASGLDNTLNGFSERFTALRKAFTWDELKDKLRFTFTTNRPIDEKVTETLEDLAAGNTARHSSVAKTLLGYVNGLGSETKSFFKLFSVEAGEPDLWNQRNLLFKDVRTYLAEADSDAPLQLKELVTNKATSAHASNPSIRRLDVLRALETDEADLWPAKGLIAEPADGALLREQGGE